MSCVAGGGGGDGVEDVLNWRLKSAAEPTLTTIPCCLPEKKNRLQKPRRLFCDKYQMGCKPHNCKASNLTST